MVKSTRIRMIHNKREMTLEPFVRRTANGELLVVFTSDGPEEPHPLNRVYFCHSNDNGDTWTPKEKLCPEEGVATTVTEVTVLGQEITAYISTHTGRHLGWKCYMYKSFDNGYTWQNYGTPPFFPEYTYIRSALQKKNGDILTPFQHYPVTRQMYDALLADDTIEDKLIDKLPVPYCHTGVLLSTDGNKTFEKYTALKMPINEQNGWIWSEPTLAELSDGRIAMLVRKNDGYLGYTESCDGGKTWCEMRQTNILNPSNKPRLIPLDKGRIALLNTPNNKRTRFPLELWISEDDMQSWVYQKPVTDFPGFYPYSDGFYENGHLYCVVDYKRIAVLFFDIELES